MSGLIGGRPLVLVLLDGWGIRAEREANALAQARTPVYDRIAGSYAHAVLTASGEAVGLAAGKPGNVQAGYMTLGAGRPVEQDILRVNRAIQDDGPRGLATNPVLQKLVQRVRPLGGAVHLIGMVSPGGVAGNQHHLAVLAAMLSHEGLQVWIHGVMDGIDARPQGGIACLAELMDDIAGAEHASLGSLMGRAFAFDEGTDENAVKSAWKAIAEADAPRVEYPSAHLDKSYAKGVADDRITPVISQNYRGIRRDDAVFLVNLRPDFGAALMQELLESEIGSMLSSACSLTALDGDGLDWVEPLFARLPIPMTLSETLSRAGRAQLLLTETVAEKNLSLFLRGGVNRIFEGETLGLAETPPLAKMEKRPELAAADLTIEALNAIKNAERDFLVVNFANVALLGRTGNMRATIEAAEAIDKYLGKIAAQVEKRGGVLAITSAFGKGELMNDPATGEIWRGPTSSNMPFTLMAPGVNGGALRFGTLADVAPTILELLGVAVPETMTGQTLIVGDGRRSPPPNPARTTSVPA
jgi:2,3-bisphosphoglycerate-independent phosphoglycerate mutase